MNGFVVRDVNQHIFFSIVHLKVFKSAEDELDTLLNRCCQTSKGIQI